MSAAPTPGPWSVVDGHYPGFREIHGASINVSIVVSSCDISLEETFRREADLQLIAAAPVMYSFIDGMAKAGNVEAAKIIGDIYGRT